jgi:tyrosyl-tRNA synthetase
LNSEHGISYTEFSYQILQGFDFLELFRRYDCILQTGGSDQWGNLTSGTDLIHKVEGKSAHLLATPLITNSDGKKFGKSEGNAVWLDADFTSPYAFYQFWLNVEDADVVDRLKVFTFLSKAEIEDLAAQTIAAPHLRAAQKRLAFEVTALVHSAEDAQAAIDASAALFGQGELTALDASTLRSALSELPNVQAERGTAIATLLVETGLVASISAGRRAIAEGGVYLNNVKIEDEAAELSDFIRDEFAVLRRGKKTLAGIFRK